MGLALPARFLQLTRGIGGTARRHRVSPIAVLDRVLRLWAGKGIRPRETLMAGLADPAVSERALSGCLSKPRLQHLQERLNPPGLECLLKDKSVFYPYVMALGLPVPRLHAVFDVLGGWSPQGAIPSGDREWEVFFRDRLPAEFVIKPAWGIYGEGFQIFTREGDRFVDLSGRTWSAPELVVSLRSHRSYRRWVIQARVRNHPELERLSGTTFLQTVRIMTFVDGAGQARAYAPHLKLIGADAVVDNIQGGRVGNFPAAIGLEDGALRAGRIFDADGTGMTTLTSHPRTGVRLEGFELPGWPEVLPLVERAARLFVPIRTIGWDLALTGTGPVIVEGNMWWDPPNDLASARPDAADPHGMPALLDLLRAEAARPLRPGRGYRTDRL